MNKPTEAMRAAARAWTDAKETADMWVFDKEGGRVAESAFADSMAHAAALIEDALRGGDVGSDAFYGPGAEEASANFVARGDWLKGGGE